jgi:hypothetical protein
MRNYIAILIISSLTLLLTANTVNGQRPYTAPGAFLPTEQVRLTVSVFGTALEDQDGPMKFLLSANEDEPNVLVDAVLASDNHWSYTFTPSPNNFFSTEVTVINGIIKTADGSIELEVFTVTPFDFTSAVSLLTVVPSRPYFTENVSLIFDRNQSDRDDLSAVAPIYMWAWNNSDFENLGDAPNQGGWGSISESTVLTQVPGYPNLWRKDFIPQAYWATNKQMTGFGCLFRSKAGDKQTNDQKVNLYKAPGLVEKPKKVKNFPLTFTKFDVVTIFYDQKLEENPDLKASSAIYVTTTARTTIYRPQPSPISTWTQDWTAIESTPAIERVKMIPYGNPADSIFRLTFVPQTFYTYYQSIPTTYALQTLFVKFRNLEGTAFSELEEILVVNPD